MHTENQSIQQIQRLLLAWFQANARDLPWRRTRDPYQILVAEIMLQQTQVDRVVPKYLAFLERFPTVHALAAAPTAEIIRMWAGLGYNRRAVNMQRAARVVEEQYAGIFPQDIAELLALPGIGPYTAGAIACFAFEQDVAFLDTNIRRAVARILYPPEANPTQQELQQAAQTLVPHGQGWAWNQGIMELGALICTAATPACWRCPLNTCCADYAARQAADTYALAGFMSGEDTIEYVPALVRPRRMAEKRETPFAGSNRFYRGRVIEALRNAPSGLTLNQLGPLTKQDYNATQDASWLEKLVAGLVRDGLAVVDADVVRLPM